MLAEGLAYVALSAQSDHQSERLLHGLLLGSAARRSLGFRHEGIIDVDIGSHAAALQCVRYHRNIHMTAEQGPPRRSESNSVASTQNGTDVRPRTDQVMN
jgi:hypothetical protein